MALIAGALVMLAWPLFIGLWVSARGRRKGQNALVPIFEFLLGMLPTPILAVLVFLAILESGPSGGHAGLAVFFVPYLAAAYAACCVLIFIGVRVCIVLWRRWKTTRDWRCIAAVVLILLVAVAAVASVFGPYVAKQLLYVTHQYQHAKWNTTMARMRVLGTVLDAHRTYVGTCDEAGKMWKTPGTIPPVALQCTDGWGEPIYLRQSRNDPAKYTIWCQGVSPETAAFVYQPEGFTRLPPLPQDVQR